MFVPNPFRTIQIANISSFYLATCAKAKTRGTTVDNTGESHLFVAQMGFFFLPCFDKCTSIQIQETLVITLVPYKHTRFFQGVNVRLEFPMERQRFATTVAGTTARAVIKTTPFWSLLVCCTTGIPTNTRYPTALLTHNVFICSEISWWFVRVFI